MRNLTRNPHHLRASEYYCKNMNSLTITVDGVKVDSQYVINVYSTPLNREPYVEMFALDDNGRIAEKNGNYLSYEIEGKIEVIGKAKYCSCWKGKRVSRWFDRVSDKRGGW